MDFTMSRRRIDLRHEVEEFVAAHLTQEMIEKAWRDGTIHDADFHRAVAERGWVGATWPTSMGGGGYSFAEFGAFWEAVHYAGAPVDGHMMTEMVGTVIVRVGTDEQQQELIPRIVAGDVLLCLGYSEPEAGSDVAAVKTRARKVDGGYLINGSKMFTSLAQVSDYVFLLARTDPDAPKWKGLTTFLVPLDASGVEIRGMETFGGERTNATFYDDVFVPESARVGQENAGWAVLGSALEIERAMMGAYVGQARRVLDDTIDALLDQDPNDRDRVAVDTIAKYNVLLEAAAALNDRVACRLTTGDLSAAEAAMTKLMVTDAFKGLADTALTIVGPSGLLSAGADRAPCAGRLEHAFRHSQIATIYGGSNEIQRNIVSQHGLGLPRG